MSHYGVAEFMRNHARQLVLVDHELDELSSEEYVTARKAVGVRLRYVDEVKLKCQTSCRQVLRESVAYVIDISRTVFVANETYLARHPLNYQLAENHLLFG